MAIKCIKSATAEGMVRSLNGMVLSKRNLVAGRDTRPNPSAAPNNLYKHPVNGLTLIFTVPVVTVTFAADLTSVQIVAAILAANAATGAHLWKVDANGGMVLALWNDAAPVTLADTGTANSYFGFSTTAADPDLVQTAINPANIKSMLIDVLSRQFITFYT